VDSVTGCIVDMPLAAALLKIHPSVADPPVAEQDAPVVATQDKVTDWPTVTVAALAVTETLSWPTPESGTWLSVPPALTFSVAAIEAAEVGVNTTLIVQADPTATDVPQVFICENCEAFAPESAMLVTGSATAPVFVTVTTIGALATGIGWMPNAKDVGDTVWLGTTPTPLSGTVRVPAPPPPLTFSVAVCDPAEVGVNTTLIVQLDPTATDAPQLLVCENCEVFAPDSVTLMMGSARAAVFVTVTALGALATFVVSTPNAKDVGDTV
jgi:Pyruvate/2-oxoacid:ferredoxin oxidoreductase delta subunit